MKAFLSRLTAFDWVKVALYGTTLCGVVTIGVLNTILKPWGFSDVEILALSAKIGSISAVFGLVGLIANTFKNTSPQKGTVPVLTTSAIPTPESLTTVLAPPAKL